MATNHQVANNIVGLIQNNPLTNVGTNLVTDSTSGTKLAALTFPYYLTLWDANTNVNTDANTEIVQVTANPSSNNFTVIRAQQGTSAVAHNQNDNLALLWTAQNALEAIPGGTLSQGAIAYIESTLLPNLLQPGTAGYVLSTGGPGADPSWVPLPIVGKGLTDTFYAAANINANDAVYITTPPALQTFDAHDGRTITAVANFTHSFTVGSNANRAMFLTLVTNAVVISTPPTYAGVSMTLADSFTTGSNYFYYYTLANPTSGANNIIINSPTMTGGYAVTSYSGVTLGTTVGNTGTGTAVSQATSINAPSQQIFTCAAFVTTNISHSWSGSTNMSGNQQTDQSSNSPYINTISGNAATQQTQGTLTVTGTISASNNYAIFCTQMYTSIQTTIPWISQASASSTTTANAFIGFAMASISQYASGVVTYSGEVSGFTGLTLGGQYLLANAAGTISTSAGSNTRKVGIAVSTTTLIITNNW